MGGRGAFFLAWVFDLVARVKILKKFGTTSTIVASARTVHCIATQSTICSHILTRHARPARRPNLDGPEIARLAAVALAARQFLRVRGRH